MKYYKTGNKNRQTYTYVGLDGRKETLVPGENGITEEFILALHRMDDNEVYNLSLIHISLSFDSWSISPPANMAESCVTICSIRLRSRDPPFSLASTI